jgi:uncharacterized phage protein (TIGR01671 family)
VGDAGGWQRRESGERLDRRADMRDIEFCGKRIDNGRRVYGSLIVDRRYTISVKPDGDFDVKAKSIRTQIVNIHFSADVDPETVGQYTGLRDKNGVKIFEGDIVKDKFGNIGIVKYSNHFLDWRIHFYKGRDDLVESKEGGVKMFEWIYPLMDLAVIGNIHDTPEILGRE